MKVLVLLCALTGPAAAQVAPSPEPARLTRPIKIASWTLLGVGLGSLAVGVGFSQLANQAYDELNTPAPDYIFNPTTERHLQVYQPVGIVFITLGAAATASSIVLLAVATHGKPAMKRLFLFWLLVACTPEPPDGAIRCARPPAKACPDGYGCVEDGTCWRHAQDYVPDASVPHDLACRGDAC